MAFPLAAKSRVAKAVGLPGRNGYRRLTQHLRAPRVEEQDRFIVSFSRSGNTWCRFLVANMAHPDQAVDFTTIEQLMPELERAPAEALSRAPRPRILKSHSAWDPRFQCVVYIARDPRDVAVSLYHFARRTRWLADDHPIEAFVREYVTRQVIREGNWQDHVNGWLHPAHRSSRQRLLFLRYEDMLSDTLTHARRLREFLELPLDDLGLERAVAESTADRMRDLERSARPDDQLFKDMRRDIPFVRTAKSETWRTELPGSSIRLLEHRWGDTMRRLGYRLSTDVEPMPSQPLVVEDVEPACQGD